MQKNNGEPFHLIGIIKERSGFTIIELVCALLLLTIFILVALSIYLSGINQAKVTVAQNAVANLRDFLNTYSLDNDKYPASINFTNCVDENSRAVFSDSFCKQLKNDLHSISYNYNPENKQYVLTARAKDNKFTIIKVTPEKFTK